MNCHITRIVIVSALLAGACETAHAAVPSYIDAAHANVLERWLGDNPGYRVATDADCRCEDDINQIRHMSAGRWKAKLNFHPYYVAGDFNWDGDLDFAVGVVKADQPKYFQLLIFQGPFRSDHRARAAYVSKPLALGQGLFFGEPRPLPHMLVVGPFESEGAVLHPSPTGYRLDPPQ